MDRRTFFEGLAATSVASSITMGLSKSASAASDAETKLEAMGLTLPEPANPVAVYVPYRVTGNLVFIAGNIPPLDVDIPTVGKVGKDLTVEQGYEAAKLVGLRIIAQLKAACDGDLGRFVQCIQIRGLVNCTPDFEAQSSVVNGVSELFQNVFGDAGLAARAALGTNALPLNAAIEVESVFEIRT